MRRSFLVLAAFCAYLSHPTTVAAQEAGKVGVTMSFPAAAGIIWHASEKIAVRPDFNFSHSESETSASEGDSDSYTLGISVLFYTKKWDNAAAYFVPRFAWSRLNSVSESNAINPFTGDTVVNETTGNAYAYSGAFGVQGWIGSRFSAFGELGLSYSTSTTKSSLTSSEFESTGFGLRSGVGIAFYF